MKKSVLAIMLMLSCCAQAAQKAYVTDRLEVQMRSGQSPQAKTLKTLISGTPLTVIGSDANTGYTHVALDSGEQGWVLTRYLTAQPVARIQLDEALKKAAEINEENQRLKAELVALKGGKDSANQASQDLTAETERLNTELIAVRQASADALKIQAQRDQLQQQVIDLERERESIKRERKAFNENDKRDWFLVGAGVLFGGIVLGLILPQLGWRKKGSWDSF